MSRYPRYPSPEAAAATAYPDHRFAVQDLQTPERFDAHARAFNIRYFTTHIIPTTARRADWSETEAPLDSATGVAPVGLITEGLYTIEELLDWQLFRRFIHNQFGEDPGAGPYRAEIGEFTSSASFEAWAMMQRVWENILLYFVRQFAWPTDGDVAGRPLPFPSAPRAGDPSMSEIVLDGQTLLD